MEKTKDWTGNKKTVFSIMGASNHSGNDRQSEDFYATDPSVLDLLSKKYEIPDVVLEPACGEGHLSKWLEEHGHKVYSFDLIDRGYGEVQNFFEMLTIPEDCRCIITNPPYKYATEFVLHALELLPIGGQVVMFLKTTFLETERRYNQIFKNTPPIGFSSSSGVPCAQRMRTLMRPERWEVLLVMHFLFGRKAIMVIQ